MQNKDAENYMPEAPQQQIVLSDEMSIEMIWCSPGTARVGAPLGVADPKQSMLPSLPIRLSRGFYMARVPVTRAIWRIVMEREPPVGRNNILDADKLPVDGMTWHEATEFCQRLTLMLHSRGALAETHEVRLPTEVQWEYACRAGTATIWYFGDDAAALAEHAWYRANSGGQLHPVGLKLPNPWGLYDMYGNVAEWCQDDFSLYQASDQELVDPVCVRAKPILKIVRGGEYGESEEECSSAYRGTIDADNVFLQTAGIRVICAEALT